MIYLVFQAVGNGSNADLYLPTGGFLDADGFRSGPAHFKDDEQDKDNIQRQSEEDAQGHAHVPLKAAEEVNQRG